MSSSRRTGRAQSVITVSRTGSWQHTVAKGLEAVLELKAIECAVPLADVYARVEFKPQQAIAADSGPDRETGSR